MQPFPCLSSAVTLLCQKPWPLWYLPDRAVLLAQRWRVQWPLGCWFGDSHTPGCHLLASKEGYRGRVQGTDTFSGQAAPDSLQKVRLASLLCLPKGCHKD